MRTPRFFRPFSYRNYRLFFIGQSISLVGNWLTTTASAWLAYELSHSAFVAGLLPFANQIPVPLFAPLAGVWGDRMDRRKMLVWLQLIGTVPSLGLMLATWTHTITVPLLLTLVVLRGLFNAMEMPTRQSFIVELVEGREVLANAIALNSTAFNVARLAGPSIAGLIIVASGPQACYGLDVLSFLPVIGCLLAMKIQARPRARAHSHPLADLREGLAYVKRSPGLQAPLLMVAAGTLTAGGANAMIPVFAEDVFHGDAALFGHMASCVGAGALVGAIVLGMRHSTAGLPRLIVTGGCLLAFGQLCVAFSPVALVAGVAMAISGIGSVLTMAGCNTLVQSRVDDDKRSRVMGLYAVAIGMSPVGSVAVGSLAEAIGLRVAVVCAAMVCLAAAITFARAREGGRSAE